MTLVVPGLRGHNPDVLTCIANLSNDEVFTPPEFANRMLDTLAAAWADANDGANIWADPTVTFLDPFTKSGVFLREITARLTEGLAPTFPDLRGRVGHILSKQIFGIGITRLTSMIARRSVYCSKNASGEHSIAPSLKTPEGNIWFERTEHSWTGRKTAMQVNPVGAGEVRVEIEGTGRCSYCGAKESEYARSEDLETHAYAFIHTNDLHASLKRMFGSEVHFDVIIGNPPYQLGSAGGTRDVPIYQHFVEQAKRLEPRFLTMVIPSRWMTAGLGLGEFRQTMLNDPRISHLHDYPEARDVFPGVDIKGGVCFFLWDAVHEGNAMVTSTRGKEVFGPISRNLGQFDVFVRDGRDLTILEKVLAKKEPSVNGILSADKEFGWTSNFDGYHSHESPGDVPIHFVRNSKRASAWIARSEVSKSPHLIDTWKVLVPKAGSGADSVPDYVLSTPMVVGSPSVCTQTFLFFPLESEEEAQSLLSYMSTRFFRFLVSIRKITQDATKATYTWVPAQAWDRVWTDAALYSKYGLTEDEQRYIESRIKEVSWGPSVDPSVDVVPAEDA